MLARITDDREYPVRWVWEPIIINGRPRLFVVDHVREEVRAWAGTPASWRRGLILAAARAGRCAVPPSPPRFRWFSGCYRVQPLAGFC